MSMFEKDPKKAAKTATLLMKIGCLPNLKNRDKLTPIFVAVQRNQKLAI